MSELEERLARLRPRKAPEDIWMRATGAGAPRRRARWKEIPMMIAAGGLIAVLIHALLPHQERQTPPAKGVQDRPWVDRETSEKDLAPEQAREIEKLIAELGAEEQERRDAASQALESQMAMAIPLVRRALDATDSEVVNRAKQLVAAWEKLTGGRKLSEWVARARKGALPEEKWTSRLKRPLAGEIAWRTHAKRALEGDAVAAGDLAAVGWCCAPLVAEVAEKESPALQARARQILWTIVRPLFEKRTRVTFERRADNDEYGKAAYSCLFASDDVAVHRNMVDLVYNGCGLLHITPFGGTKSRVADLGEKALEDVREAPEKGWREKCVRPQVGHAYVLEASIMMSAGPLKYAVKFAVVALDGDKLTIEWAPLGEMPKWRMPAGMGRSGTMGQCGGPHEDH